VHPVTVLLATVTLFFAPGLLWVAAVGGRPKPFELTLGEQVFLTIGGSIIVSGWVGFTLAELGMFSPVRAALVVAGVVALLAVIFRKHLRLHPGPLSLEEAVVLVSLCGFALLVYFPPFDYVLGGKDPGVYVNTGFHVAREGNLAYVDPLVKAIPPDVRGLFFRNDPNSPPWSEPRFLGFYLESPASGLVLPQGLHLYPVWIGMASALYQMKAGLYATPFFALVAVAGFFLAVRRLFGAEVALWATGLLTVFQIQVWFARFPNAEIVAQFLYLTGLLAFYFMQEKRSSLAGALAGFALGSSLLVRLDSILFLVPIGLYMAWLRFERRFGRPEAAMLVTFGALGVHASLHAWLFSRPYVAGIFGRWYWRAVGENLPLLLAITIAVFLAVDWLAPRIAARTLGVVGTPKAGVIAAGAIFIVALYAYFVRPVWHAARTAPHDAEAFLRMGWYLYPMGVALAVAGTMILLIKKERAWGLFLLAGLTFSFFFFYKIRVSNDHFFGMRRFIPVILPSLFVAISVFLVTLRRAGGRIGPWASGLIGATLLVIYLGDGRPLWNHMEFRGSLRFVEDLGRFIGARDVVIFPRREGLHLLELPLSQLEGKNVLEFYTLKPDKNHLERLLQQWRGHYQDIYFITNYKISLSGFFTRHVMDFSFATEKYEFTYVRPPVRSEPFSLRFTLSKAVDLEELAGRMPKIDFIDVGGSDDPLVAWFHEKELDEGVSYRWSQRTSTVFLPGLSPQSRELSVRLAGPQNPRAPAAQVSLSLNGYPLASLGPGPTFETYRLALPPESTARLDEEFPVLRIDSKTWRPSRSLPGSSDIRDLGVRLDWIQVH
jgi:hypothetical protein